MLTNNQKSDAQFILNPGYWPKWPSLPMKDWGNDRNGFLLDNQPLGIPIDKKAECYRKVYLVNPWEFFTESDPKKKVKLADVPTKVYESVEAMLEDGWQVD